MNLPLAPLMALAGFDHATVQVPCRNGGYSERWAGQTFLAELTFWSKTAVRGWVTRGLSVETAEDVCDRLGIHPCEVWGDLWIEAVLEVL